jgi:signal peptidase I
VIYIKRYKAFESVEDVEDDYDIMARYQIFSGDCFVSFYFRDILVKDKSEMLELIEIYNNLSKKDNEWVGGPVSRSFDEYFIKRYKPILGDVINFKLNNPWKPTIGLTFKTEYGYLQTGFSLKNKKMTSLYSNTFDLSFKSEFEKNITNLKIAKTTELSKLNTYDKKVISEMYKLLKLYWNNELGKLVIDMNLNIDFDWIWND